MDAASNTGVDNIREIIESARYRPLVARYKVYLIDEVHMLSKGAFNALLKTLEEPPGHVKFIFATTEVRKVPVTVLSRCQRFDLRRVDVPVLVEHFKKIVAKEGGEAEDDALALIARAAEGSVRDGLSLLDQALAMSAGSVSAGSVRAMLGLADRGRIFDLLEKLLGGIGRRRLEQFARLAPRRRRAAAGAGRSGRGRARRRRAPRRSAPRPRARDFRVEEKRRAAALGGRLSMAILSRAWQMLLKGLEEAANAPNPAAAAEMVLIRLAYTADLPAPDEIIKALGGDAVPACGPASRLRRRRSGWRPRRPSTSRTPTAATRAISATRTMCRQDHAPAALPIVRTFAEVVALASARREAKLKVHLEEHVSLVKFDPAGSIELHLLAGAPKELANELREKLNAWTGKRWMVALSKAPGERTDRRYAAASAPLPRSRTCNAIRPWPRCCSSFPTPRSPACGNCRRSTRTTPEPDEGHSGAVMKDLMKLMKQAREIQGRMQKMQEELAALEVEGQSGAGLVTVSSTARWRRADSRSTRA